MILPHRLRVAPLLLTLLLVAGPLAAAAHRPQEAWRSRLSAGGLLSEAWALVSRIWGKAGSSTDPFGKEDGSIDPFGKEGGSTDPFGKEGSGIDPFGKEGSSTDPFGKAGGSIDPFGNPTPNAQPPSNSTL